MVFLILGALIVGLTLGLLGSGGSIVTVPVLVYLLGHEDKAAIAESLAIVGGIALVAMLPYSRSREVDWRSVLLFGVPGMMGTYLGAWLSNFVSGAVQLLLFGLVMLPAAWSMYRRSGPSATPADTESGVSRHAAWKIMSEGLAVGVLTGLVGVGGGFLIVPALVLLGGLPMRLAVGTSLVVIAMKSLTGFVKYLGVLESLGSSVDWQTIAIFSAVGILGSFAGNMLSKHIDAIVLKRIFAVFLVAMGVFVIARELPQAIGPGTGSQAAATASIQQIVREPGGESW